MTVRALAIVCLVLLSSPQVRDAPSVAPAGTGAINGSVVTDEPTPAPIRRARVTLNGLSVKFGMTVITDDRGRFEFSDLPVGSYLLSARKAAYLTTNHGARSPGGPGAPLAIAARETKAGVVIRMIKGAVIGGTVLDQNGDPSATTTIAIGQFTTTNGQRTLTTVRTQIDQRTDDQGGYRIYGLPPGEYVVAAVQLADSSVSEVRPTTAADLARAAAGQRGVVAAPSSPTSTMSPAKPQAVGFAPIYYPGTLLAQSARVVRLAPGEERTDIDFRLSFVSTSTITGIASRADGASAANAQVRITPTGPSLSTRTGGPSIVAADGSFSASGIAPGQYIVTIEIRLNGPNAAGTGRSQQGWWASTDVVIEGRDVKGLSLVMEKEPTVTGRILFDGAAPPPTTGVVIDVVRAATGGLFTRATATPDRTFAGEAIQPGPYRVTASAAMPWILKSVTIGGQNVADLPVDLVGSRDVSDVIVTFTDRPSGVAGTVKDDSGRGVGDRIVIVFPRDRTFWLRNSRRIVRAQPDAGGQFARVNLPPGEYLTAAVTTIGPDDLFDPAFLESLIRGATPVTVSEGATAAVDVRVRR